jgi:hypothetical protein
MAMTQLLTPGPQTTAPAPTAAPDRAGEFRATARRCQERAMRLRAWSHDARPVLDSSLRRRAAELELSAAALLLRAEGIEAAAAAVAPTTTEED